MCNSRKFVDSFARGGRGDGAAVPAQLHGGGRVLAAGVRGALRPGLRPPLHRHAARDPPRAGLAARGGLPRPGGRGHARWQHQHTVVNTEIYY